MAKVATAWRNKSGSATAVVSASDYLLTELSDFLVQEDGSLLLLNETTMTPKESSLWHSTTKSSSAWRPRDNGTATVVAITTRITEISDTRITETGDTRITQETTITTKIPAVWRNA